MTYRGDAGRIFFFYVEVELTSPAGELSTVNSNSCQSEFYIRDRAIAGESTARIGAPHRCSALKSVEWVAGSLGLKVWNALQSCYLFRNSLLA